MYWVAWSALETKNEKTQHELKPNKRISQYHHLHNQTNMAVYEIHAALFIRYHPNLKAVNCFSFIRGAANLVVSYLI